MQLKFNIGQLDRALRILLGVALVVLAAIGMLGPWAWIGLLPLLTGWFGYCPAYALFGFSTCRTRGPK